MMRCRVLERWWWGGGPDLSVGVCTPPGAGLIILTATKLLLLLLTFNLPAACR